MSKENIWAEVAKELGLPEESCGTSISFLLSEKDNKEMNDISDQDLEKMGFEFYSNAETGNNFQKAFFAVSSERLKAGVRGAKKAMSVLKIEIAVIRHKHARSESDAMELNQLLEAYNNLKTFLWGNNE
ncbi:MAG: hypothetical protein KC483_10795 [Nitrosarchaeum sp.]|nr:hypothetical protein [Nitrosarchaeum sp.]